MKNRSGLIVLATVFSLFFISKISAQSMGSSELITGGFGIAPGGTTSSISETVILGPGVFQIDGTWDIYAKYVFIDPMASISGGGVIRFYNPTLAGGLPSATYIDGNATLIDVNIEQHNELNMVLVDADNPFSALGTADGIASLYVGRTIDFSEVGADIVLAELFTDADSPSLTGVGNTTTTITDLILDNDATLSGYGVDGLVVTNNSIQGHIVKENLLGSFEFPVGIMEGDYTPVIIQNSGTASGIHVSVQNYTGSISTEQVGAVGNGMQRTWNIYADAMSGPVLDIALQHNQSTDQTQFNENSSFVTRWSTVIPNYTGDLTITTNDWQSNTLGASIPGSILNSFVRNRVYTDFAASATDELAYYSKSSCLITPLDEIMLTLTCPPDTLVDCTASTDTSELGAAVAVSCDAIDSVYYTDELIAGCPSTLVRTWYASTASGLMDSCVQTILIQDTVAPTFDSTPPSDAIAVACTDDIPAPTVITASDNCGAVTVYMDELRTDGACFGQYTLERRWLAIDACGNTTVSESQLITVNDTTGPVFNEVVPGDIVVSCDDAIPPADVLTASDCTYDIDNDADGNFKLDGSLLLNIQEAMGGYDTNNDPYGMVGTYLVNDYLYFVGAGNTFIPNPLPEFDGITFTITTANLATGAQPNRVYPDSFGSGVDLRNARIEIVFSSDVFFTINGEPNLRPQEYTAFSGDGTIFVPYPNVGSHSIPTLITSVTDPYYLYNPALGNANADVITGMRSIYGGIGTQIIVEHRHPVTSSPGYLPLYHLELFPQQDLVTFQEDTLAGTCANNYDIVRTWTATDDCGNETVHTQTITVQDTIAPVFDSTPPSDAIAVACTDDIPAAAVITASDNCGAATVYVDELRIDGACFGQYTLERRWVAIDACGNTAISSPQMITVNDTTGPMFNETLPGDLLVSCEDVVPPADVLTASDCTHDIDNDADGNFRLDGSLLLNIQEAMGGYDTDNGNPYGVVGTYLVNDYLYTYANGTQNPAIPNPIPEYDGITFTITTTDLTTGPEPSRVSPNGFGNGVNLQNARVEIAFSSEVFFTINGNPNSRAQEYIEFSGDGTKLVPYPNVGSHTDPNLITSVTGPYYLYNPNAFDPTNPNLNRANNTRSIYGGVGTQLIVDHRHPVNTGTDNLPLFELQLFPQQDLVTFEEDTLAGACANAYTITRTWTATDDCDNETVHTQIITIQDTLAPVFAEALPGDTTVNCDAIPTAVTLTATDNCGTASVTYTESTTAGSCANTYTLTREWVAEDECGNLTVHTQTVMVQDTLTPVFVEALPGDTTVNCDAIPTVATLTATDNCGTASVTYTESTTAGSCANTYTLTREWVAEDECGNLTTHTQTVIVQDTLAPVFAEALPGDTTVNCDAIPAAATLMATDNCGTATVTYSENTTAGACPNAYTLTREWVAEDECGNLTTHTQTVIVQDTLAPVFAEALPGDTTVNCDAIPAAATLTATDNCGTAAVTYSENTTAGACPNAYTLTREWVAEDECGNQTLHTQVITVQDTLAPVFVEALPGDTTVNCGAIPTGVTLTATDNCGTSTVNYTESTTAGACPNAYTLTREWVAEDECGNQTLHTQVITVQDTLAPVFAEVLPGDTTVNCDVVPLGVTLTATDNCGTATVIYSENMTAGTCPNAYTLTREWVAADECGNLTTHTQTVMVQDTVAPVLSACPADIVVENDTDECGAVVNWVAPTAQDNCSDVEVTASHTSGNLFPVGVTTVTYTATDECGNQTSCSFDVTVEDVQKPAIVVEVADHFCEGDDVTWQADISDNCEVATVVSSHDPGDNFDLGVTVVSYTVTDIYGNDSTYTFEVTIVPMPQAGIAVSKPNLCLGGDLVMSAENPDANNTYTWYQDMMEVGTGVDYSVATVGYGHAGTYTLEVSNEFGCQSEATVDITVKPCGIIIVETFSPNMDGINDYFHVENLEAFPNTRVWIYNRWGTEVYYSDNYQNDWDGRSQSQFNVGGDELPEGTYYYLLELGGDASDPMFGKMYKGYVYIKRQ